MEEFDNVVRACTSCQEEYQLPEDLEICPICGNATLSEEE